jgi:predicted glutamine amidotransferase
MCRLLGFASATPTSARRLVGDSDLAQFTALSCLHGDGWGTAAVAAAGATPVVHRSASAADSDTAYDRAVRDDARARIIHLRWATDGYRVEAANTHPFSAAGIAFAHNGGIVPTDALDGLLDRDSRASLVGQTDSERYFALIRQELADGGSLAEAAMRAASALRARYPHASLNALLLTSDELIVVHANSPEGAPVDELAALPGGAPFDHLSSYFLMRWRQAEDGSLIFVSSGLPANGWTPLPEETVTSVDLRTLRMRHLALAAAPSVTGRVG